MTELNPFTHIPPGVLLYFHYGLTFIFLGVAIIAKDMKGSNLKIAVPLQSLAVFGFTHGTLEWLELYRVFIGAAMSSQQVLVLKTLGLFFGVISFFFLINFGLRLMNATTPTKRTFNWFKVLHFFLIALWVSIIGLLWFQKQTINLSLIQDVEIITRYCLAFPGSIFSSLALLIYSNKAKSLNEDAAKKLSYAGISFLFYGLFAGIIPSKMMVPVFDVPIEFFRMFSALGITFFMVKALNIFDVETRQALEEQIHHLAQAEKLASVGQLAAGIAHEINNPLTNASLNVQLLQQSNSQTGDKKVSTQLDSISRNIDRASVIARELLQFSRSSEDGNLEIIDPHQIILNAIDTVEYRLDSIKITEFFEASCLITGNVGKLQQVVTNTLNNSIEALRGQGEIQIKTSQNSDTLTIMISDNGIGISEEKLARLFEPFFTTKEVGAGTGLGLFICYSIMKQHNGTIAITSTPNKGTIVKLKLPIHHETKL